MNETRFGEYGSRNTESKWVDAAEVAKAVRADIKFAQTLAANDPMRLPKGIKVSVKTRRYAGGQSLDLVVKALPGKVTNPAWQLHAAVFPHEIQPSHVAHLTKEAARVVEALERIVGMYNFDESDAMRDYFHTAFYAHVSIDQALEQLPTVDAELVSDAKVMVMSGNAEFARQQVNSVNEGYWYRFDLTRLFAGVQTLQEAA